MSVGLTSVGERACFGVYADPHVLRSPDVLARDIGHEIDELLRRTR